MKGIWIISTIVFGFFLTGCEGFKVITIHNTSESDALVTVKPGIESFDSKKNIIDYPKYFIVDSSSVVLQPDSSITIMSIFTILMFNTKIKERELRTDYLRIETENDSVVANSKKEIIDILYGRRRNNIKSKGRNWVTIRILE